MERRGETQASFKSLAKILPAGLRFEGADRFARQDTNLLRLVRRRAGFQHGQPQRVDRHDVTHIGVHRRPPDLERCPHHTQSLRKDRGIKSNLSEKVFKSQAGLLARFTSAVLQLQHVKPRLGWDDFVVIRAAQPHFPPKISPLIKGKPGKVKGVINIAPETSL